MKRPQFEHTYSKQSSMLWMSFLLLSHYHSLSLSLCFTWLSTNMPLRHGHGSGDDHHCDHLITTCADILVASYHLEKTHS